MAETDPIIPPDVPNLNEGSYAEELPYKRLVAAVNLGYGDVLGTDIKIKDQNGEYEELRIVPLEDGRTYLLRQSEDANAGGGYNWTIDGATPSGVEVPVLKTFEDLDLACFYPLDRLPAIEEMLADNNNPLLLDAMRGPSGNLQPKELHALRNKLIAAGAVTVSGAVSLITIYISKHKKKN